MFPRDFVKSADMRLKQILNSENFYREKLHELVEESLKEEQLVSQKLMEIESDRNITFGQRLADRVAQLRRKLELYHPLYADSDRLSEQMHTLFEIQKDQLALLRQLSERLDKNFPDPPSP